jgi:ribose 5-phosphate isomerase RpiB
MVIKVMAVIALGADHAGWPLKEAIKVWLSARDHIERKEYRRHVPAR